MARQIGLRDIHIAVLSKDDSTGATYSKPEKLERAIGAKLNTKTNSDNIYSDDSVKDIITAFEGIDVEIEVNQLSLFSRAKLQGAKVVKGVLVENKDDIPPTIALGFKSKKNNGKYRYVWLLKGKFFSRDFDGNYRFICDEDEQGVEVGIISGWFGAVPSDPSTVV